MASFRRCTRVPHRYGSWQAVFGQCRAQQFAKTALDPVAHHGIADPLGHGDAIANAVPAVGVSQQHKAGTCNAQPAIGGEKIAASGEHFDHGELLRKTGPQWEPARATDRPQRRSRDGAARAHARTDLNSCTQLLAAARAAGAQDLAATRSRLASEKAVATGAHEIA